MPCTCTLLIVMFIVSFGIHEGKFFTFYLLGLDTMYPGSHVHCFPHIHPRRNALKLKKWVCNIHYIKAVAMATFLFLLPTLSLYKHH